MSIAMTREVRSQTSSSLRMVASATQMTFQMLTNDNALDFDGLNIKSPDQTPCRIRRTLPVPAWLLKVWFSWLPVECPRPWYSDSLVVIFEFALLDRKNWRRLHCLLPFSSVIAQHSSQYSVFRSSCIPMWRKQGRAAIAHWRYSRHLEEDFGSVCTCVSLHKYLAGRFGKLMGILRLNLLLIAGSRSHGTLVVETTTILCWVGRMLCICTRNSVLILRLAFQF